MRPQPEITPPLKAGRGEKSLTVTVRDQVATIAFSRPDRANALTFRLLEELEATLERLERDPNVRAIVVTGEGERFFSSGFDLDDLILKGADLSDEGSETVIHEVGPIDRALTALSRYPKPTIAMVNGYAVGAACEMVLCCDFAIAAEPATFRMPPASLGLVYSPIGFARFLSHIGLRYTKELFLTAKEIPSQRAKEMGLVHETVPTERLGEEVSKLARLLAQNSPRVIAATKRILTHLVSKDLSPQDVVEIRELLADNRASRDLREGLGAALTKRKPEFPGD